MRFSASLRLADALMVAPRGPEAGAARSPDFYKVEQAQSQSLAAQKSADKIILWMQQDLRRRAGLNYAAFIHHQHISGDAQSLIHVMRNKDNRLAALGMKTAQFVLQTCAADRIKGGERLVHQG